MRAIGIDFGERRIGIALSDPAGRMALPWGTLERRNDRSAVRQIADLARREGVARLVLGDPRAGDGSVGPASERVRRFGLRLAEVSGLEVELIDESLTSVEAAARLREAGVGARTGRERQGQGATLDAVAATVLLEEALGGARTTLLPAPLPTPLPRDGRRGADAPAGSGEDGGLGGMTPPRSQEDDGAGE
jgi:putative Holliday junction resolvase